MIATTPCRSVSRKVATLLLLLACTHAAAQAYPTKPVRVIVPFPPGATFDTTVRMLAQHMSPGLGQPVVVENKAGAGGILGTAEGARAAPDGYTIVAVANNFATTPAVRDDLPFDAAKDFAPVIFIGWISQILAVPASSPVNSAQELVAMARQNPGTVSYCSLGDGSMGHFVGKRLEQVTNVQLLQVPFRGSAQSLPALVSGQISMCFGNVPEVLGYARSGRLKALAIATPERTPLAPDLPTLAEAGVPGVYSQAWYGFLAPAGTPAPIVNRLNQETAKALAVPEVRERLGTMGITIANGTPAEFGAMLRRDLESFAKLAREANIKVSK